MKKNIILALTAAAVLSINTAWAKDDAALLKEAAQKPVTVAEIKTLKDETAVSLKGTLVKHLNQDHYEFSDGTGLILLDIDDDLWKSSSIQAGDEVHVLGEVDTHRYKPTDIEVLKIEKLPK